MAHPFIPFENTARVEMVILWYGQYVENVFHCHNTAGSYSTVEMALLAAHFKDWWNTNLKTSMPTSLSLQKIRVKDLTTENSPGIEYTTGLPLTGTLADPGAASNVTVAIKWTTGFSGRSYRGRTYHLGLLSQSVTADAISGAQVSNLITSYSPLINSMLADWQLVVASSYHNGAWRTSGVSTPITGISIDPYVDSQRRRLVGRGR